MMRCCRLRRNLTGSCRIRHWKRKLVVLLSAASYAIAIHSIFFSLGTFFQEIPSHHTKDENSMTITGGVVSAAAHRGFSNRLLHRNPVILSGNDLHFVVMSLSLPHVNNAGPDGSSMDILDPSWSYMFYAPLTASAWVQLGSAVLVILVGPETEWKGHRATRFILEELRSKGPAVKLFFLDDDLTRRTRDHDVVLALSSRLYAAAILSQRTDFNLGYSGKKIWLTTSDSDTLPVDGKNILSSFSRQDSEIRIASPARCCGMFRNPLGTAGSTLMNNDSAPSLLWLYPYAYITMTVESWLRIMRIDPELPVTGSLVMEDLVAVHGRERVFRKSAPVTGVGWNTDQEFFSLRLAQYLTAAKSSALPMKANRRILNFINRKGKYDRVDRAAWVWPPAGVHARQVSLNDVTDAHMLRNGHTDESWQIMRAFFIDAFGVGTVKDFEAFRRMFLQLLRVPHVDIL